MTPGRTGNVRTGQETVLDARVGFQRWRHAGYGVKLLAAPGEYTPRNILQSLPLSFSSLSCERW
jgi:hypothetical protein